MSERQASENDAHPLRVECIRNGCQRDHIVRMLDPDDEDAPRVIPPGTTTTPPIVATEGDGGKGE